MYQVDNTTAAQTRPASTTAGTPGWFTGGNPSAGVPATVLDAEFMNMLMAEIISVIQAAGVTLSKTTSNQLLTSIQSLATTAASSTSRANLGVNVAGGANVTLTTTQAGYGALTLVGALTANINLVFPVNGMWTVNNQTTGAFTVNCTTPSGTGYIVRQGFTYSLYADGANMQPDGMQFYDGTATAPTLQNLEAYLTYS